MRAGMIFKKIGMTHIYAETGGHQAVTILKNADCVVLEAAEGRVRIGAGEVRAKHVPKPQRGFYQKLNLPPRRIQREFRVDGDLPKAGEALNAAHFTVGQFVDAEAQSIGKGFAGAMKRHHFRGLRASHGVSVSHRALGSTGQCQDPGKVFKGKKMAGHMGARRNTIQNLQVLGIDAERDLVFVKGAVPGARGGWVKLRDAVKKPAPKIEPVETKEQKEKEEKEQPAAEAKK